MTEPGGSEGRSDGPEPDATPEGRWRRNERRAGVAGWIKAIVGVVAAAVAVYVGAALLLRALVDPAALAAWLEPRAEAAVNRDVELEGARLTFFPGLGAEFTGLEVRNLPDFEGPPLARIESLRLEVALLPLLRRRIQVDEVRIASPVFHLGVDAEGKSNFGDLVPARDTTARGGPIALDVRSLGVSEGRVEYVSAPDSVRVAVEDFSMDASLSRRDDGRWALTGRASAPGVRVRHPLLGRDEVPFRGVALETRAVAAEEFDSVRVEEGTLRLEEAALSLTGSLTALKEPVRRVDLRLTADGLELERLAGFLPDSVRRSLPGTPVGTLVVDAGIRGEAGPERAPEVYGSVTLDGGGLQASSGLALAEGLEGTVELAGDSVTIRELRGTVLEGPFSLAATVRTDSLLPFRATVHAAPRLEHAARFAELPDGTALEGTIDAGFTVTGRVDRPAAAAVEGSAAVRGLRIEHARLGVPVEVPTGRIGLAGREARWEDLVVGLGPDRITVTGAVLDYLSVLDSEGDVVPHLGASVRSAHLDLDRVVPPRGDTAMTYGKVAFARLGSRSLDGRSPEEVARDEGFVRPAPLPLTGEVEVALDTLRTAPYTLTDVAARIALSPELFEVSEIDARLFGGSVRGGLSLGLGEEENQPFALRLVVDGVQAAEFLAATSPLGEDVAGSLGLELNLGGSVDTLLLPEPRSVSGEGRFRVADGRIEANPVTALLARALSRPGLTSPGFSEWSGPFRLESSSLRFDEATLALEQGDLRYGGLIGLDGALDLGLRIAMAGPAPDSAALARRGLLGAVAGRLLGGESPVRLGLRLRGTVFDPSVAPEVSLATGNLEGALEAELRGRADSLRAAGESRLDEARDTTRASAEAVRDTAAARLEAERREVEERARREAEAARRELQERGRGLLQRLTGARDTAARTDTAAMRADTAAVRPPDTLGRDTIPPDSSGAVPGSGPAEGGEAEPR